jgi:acyl-CoA synthetase (AMP-forming)/AMP-acid ligase II
MAMVSQLLSARAREQPERVAFLGGADGRTLTWRAVAQHAEQWRRLVRTGGISMQSRVGLVLGDPLDFTLAYLGCLSAGLTAAPIDPRLTTTELTLALARLRVDVLATDNAETLLSRPEIDTWQVGLGGPEPVWSVGRASRPSDCAARRPAVLLTSSGTTGRPKGIPLSEWQLVHAASRVARHHRFGPAERGYSPLPLFHVNAQVMGLLATVVGGGSLVIDRRFDAGEYWSRVERWSPTWLNTVPAILASLAKQPAPPGRVVDRVRFARSASAPLPPATSRAFTEQTGVGVLETYGMSEGAGQITANPLDAGQRKLGSVGVPIELDLMVADPDGSPVPAGGEGEVLLRGPQVIRHYLELSESEPERMRTARTASGWLRTGDVGALDGSGFLYLAGRADDVINRGGEKIYPQEVENVLLGHPAVVAVAVVGAPHARLGQVPVAFVTVRGGSGDALTESLHTWCGDRLARYKRPTVIEVTDALPVGPTGKVLRRALRTELATAGGAA